MPASNEERDTLLAEHARNIRRAVIKMVTVSRSAHVGSALSCVDLLTFIYGEIMAGYEKDSPHTPRFLLSKGHAAAALYATLAEFGYFGADVLDEYCAEGSRLGGHLLKSGLPGIEAATGSLGHGPGIAIGLAYGLPSRPPVYVLVGDGECNEGSVWEAAILAARLKLGNLTLIVDDNGMQAYPIEPGRHGLGRMFEAAGWRTTEVDGHDFAALREALAAGGRETPLAVVAKTVKGKGVSFMENQLVWHYRSPSQEEYVRALEELR